MIAVTGASGFIGSYLLRFLEARGYETLALWHDTKPSVRFSRELRLDLTQSDSLDLLREFKPTSIFHAAAVTSIERACADSVYCWRLNFRSTKRLAGIARELSIPMVYFSTDMVFSGKHAPYREAHSAHPISVYGSSKLAAEKVVLDLDRGLVIRTALVYGFHHKRAGNFFSWMLERLSKGQKVPSFTDQFRTPIEVNYLTKQTVKAFETSEWGLFHLAGAERLSRYDFNLLVAEKWGYDSSLILPITMESAPSVVARPKDLSLDTRKASTEWGFRAQTPNEGLSNCMQFKAL